MKDLIILGAGGAGFDIVSIVRCINSIRPTWNILGFLDDNTSLIGPRFLDCKVLGTIDECDHYPDAFFVSSIAHPNNRIIRKRIYEKVESKGCKFAIIIHPSVIVYEECVIGDGCVINANTVIGSKVTIGKDVHIAYGCNIAHEDIIGNHSVLGSGVNISSGVNVGENCYIGCGVSTTHDISIVDNTLVTVGSAVVRSLKNKGNNTWIGNPAESETEFMKKHFTIGRITKREL